MPFIDPSIRLQLGLVVSCPSTEDIQQAAAARGLSWNGAQLTQLPPAKPSKPSTKAAAING